MMPFAANSRMGEVWVGKLGVRVHVAEGSVREIELLPLTVKKNRPRVSKISVLGRSLKEIKEYLSGKRRHFTIPFRQEFATKFHERVYTALMEIPYGKVVSYGELAHLAGAPRAARAVGSAMKRNRLCLLVPCHRVVASNGIGGYNGQIEWKRGLLAIEAGT